MDEKKLAIIATKGSLDWAYPPFILATTAAAMGLPVTLFFTFYGLPLLLKTKGKCTTDHISPAGGIAPDSPAAKYLIDQGVSGSRIKAKGHGEDKPIASNKTRSGREQNRRVEFKITSQ